MSRSIRCSILFCVCLAVPGAVFAETSASETAGSPIASSPEPTTPATQAAPAPDPPPGVPDLSGRWYSEFGYLDLEQEGRRIRGTYSCCGGTLEGEVHGDKMDFEWSDPIYGEGWGTFRRRSSEPHRLLGGWGRSEDFGYAGNWHAVRVPAWSFEGERSVWRVETEDPSLGRLDATAYLYRTGEEVEGYLEGHFDGEAGGNPLRTEVLYRLSGEWDDDRLRLNWTDLAVESASGPILLGGFVPEAPFVGTWGYPLTPEARSVRFVPVEPEAESAP